jgi:hypothetical protein
MVGLNITPALERVGKHVHWASPLAVTMRTVQGPRLFAIRDDVPFDKWFSNYINSPAQKKMGGLQARVNALASFGEGLFWSLVDTVTYVFARVFYRHKCDDCWYQLKAQWNGFTLSALAVISPNTAKERFLDFWAEPENQAAYRDLTFYDYDKLVNKA